MDEKIILFDPHPRKIDLIFSAADKKRLEKLGKVLWHEGQRAPDDYIDEYLSQTIAIVGQTAMPRARLDHAPHLRLIANVEGNFLPNIDYEECYRRNIHVLSCSTAFAPAVAEMALGLALACARGIPQADAAFRQGREVYSGASNLDGFLLRNKTFGLIGCGNVGRRLLPFLQPFGGEILVHDPWLHDHFLDDLGVRPVALNELLERSRIIFMIATATSENEKGLGAKQFAMMQKGTVFVLVGRAQVVDFEAMLDAAESGHIRAAIDVFPEEPVPAGHRVRRTANVILSGHRSGGLPETYREVGTMVVDELELVLRGLRPQRMQAASIETAARYRSKPVG